MGLGPTANISPTQWRFLTARKKNCAEIQFLTFKCLFMYCNRSRMRWILDGLYNNTHFMLFGGLGAPASAFWKYLTVYLLPSPSACWKQQETLLLQQSANVFISAKQVAHAKVSGLTFRGINWLTMKKNGFPKLPASKAPRDIRHSQESVLALERFLDTLVMCWKELIGTTLTSPQILW